MEDIVSLREISLKDSDLVGKKATYLAELYNKKFPIPPALVITGNLFVKYVDLVGLKEFIANILSSDKNDKEKSNEIQKAIVSSHFPEDLATFLYDNYMSLNVNTTNTNNLVQSQNEPYVAVKISSTSEKLEDIFFLNIKGKERLLNSIKACWASVFSEKNLALKRFKPNIIIQKMINSKKSGYIYTSNPKTNNPNELVIEVCSGLGNALSMKKISASQYILNKEEFDVISSNLVEQLVQYSLDFSQEKTVKLNLDEPIRNIMDEFIIKELGKLGKKIELRFNKPQKVLFAIDKQISIIGTNDLIINTEVNNGIKSSEFVHQPVSENINQNQQTTEYQESNENIQNISDNTQENKDYQETNTIQTANDDEMNYNDVKNNFEQKNDEFIEENNTNNYDSENENFDIENLVEEDKTEDEIKSSIHTDDFDDSAFFDQPPKEDIKEQQQTITSSNNENNFSNNEINQDYNNDNVENEKIEIHDYDKVIENSEDTLNLYDEVIDNSNNKDENTKQQTLNTQEMSTDVHETNNNEIKQSQNNNLNDNYQQERESFMSKYMNTKPEIAYQKAISFNSSMLVIACDMTILSALKNKYKSVFSKDCHNYFNEIINELKMQVNIPYESEIKKIHSLRDLFMNEYKELSPQDVSFILDFTRKFLQEF